MQKISSQEAIALEQRYSAANYHPLPVVLSRGEGVYVYDAEDNRYYDSLSAYSAVNQGHCHPVIYKALVEQAQTLTLTSRAFHSEVLSNFCAYITKYFGYEQVIPTNTGVEAVETAIKVCRKWGYEQKGVQDNEARIVVCEQGFHGRTTTVVSFSTDPVSRQNFGPYAPGFDIVPYDDIAALETALQQPNVVGFLVEPIQGEAGVRVPDPTYLAQAAALCKQHNVLFVADEIQTGIGRTGALLATCGACTCSSVCEQQASYVRPDILLLGKALSGGFYPVSALLTSKEILSVLSVGTHGSTFGGNPLGCAVAIAALQVVQDEGLIQNARTLGERLSQRLAELAEQHEILHSTRGRGLLQALIVNDSPDSDTAWRLCVALKDNGLLAKPTHGNIIRFAPPLVINEAQLDDCCAIIARTVQNFQ